MQIPEKELYVSDTFIDDPTEHEYKYLQDAIDAVPAWGRYLIKLKDNIMGLKELYFPENNTNIRIDGNGQYGIVFDSLALQACKIERSQTLKFTNMTYIRGNFINIDNDGSNIYFENCQNVIMTIKLIRGRPSNLYIKNTKIFGFTDNPVIEIMNDDSKAEIYNSFLKGSLGYPALHFHHTTSDGNIKIKDSTILGNNEHAIISQEKVGVLMYNCTGSERLDSQLIVNYIYDNNELIDSEITF